MVGYSPQRQRRVFMSAAESATRIYEKAWNALQKNAWSAAATAGMATAAIFLLKILALLRKRRHEKKEAPRRGPFYQLFRALARLGLRRKLGETPMEYASIIARRAEELPDIRKAVRLFYAWRYGSRDTLAALDAEVASIMARMPKRLYPVIAEERERSIAADGP